MSIEGKRAEIAAALSGVDGLTATPYPPSTMVEGHAWPLWGGAEPAEGYALEHTWRVFVVLPADPQAASVRTDELLSDVMDALRPVGYVDAAEPIALQTSGGDLSALRFTMRSE